VLLIGAATKAAGQFSAGKVGFVGGILNLERGTYPPYGIDRDVFVCLLVGLTQSGDWIGFAVPPLARGCAEYDDRPTSELLANPLATKLAVTPFGAEADLGSGDHVPRLARWEWREGNEINTIGIRCGRDWCQIGPDGFAPGQHEAPPYVPAGPAARRKYKRIKGWHDYQMLAVNRGTPDAPRLVPSSLRGRIAPHEDFNPATIGPAFATAATVHLTTGSAADQAVYAGKFGLAAGDNTVELCRGTWQQCTGQTTPAPCAPEGGETFFARISSAGSTDPPAVRCVKYVAHSGGTPAGARWGWDPKDEGMWMRCFFGCCQIKGP
jgi:hypothetical protein